MGNINDNVNLAAGGVITYIVTATINPSSLGTLSNTATVTPPAGVTDSDLSKQQQLDQDTLMPQADLGVTKVGTPEPVTAGRT